MQTRSGVVLACCLLALCACEDFDPPEQPTSPPSTQPPDAGVDAAGGETDAGGEDTP